MSSLTNVHRVGLLGLPLSLNQAKREVGLVGLKNQTYIGGGNQPNRLEKYESALKNIPPPGSGCHPYLMTVANLGAVAGLPVSVIVGDILQAIPKGKRTVTEREVADAARKAATEAGRGPGRYTPPPPVPAMVKRLDGAKYRQRLIQRGDGATEYELWELSPLRIDWSPGPMDALCLLDTLYTPKETIFTGERYNTGVDTVEAVMSHIERSSKVPPHIIPNPLDGNEHTTSAGTVSRRCDAAVKSYRFALVEFDTLSREEQAAYWFTVITEGLLPVAALIDSGGKSFHAWVRVDLPDREAWDRVVKAGMFDATAGTLALQGADSSCKNPSRLSRLPGHYRHEKQRWQRLLYLNGGAS